MLSTALHHFQYLHLSTCWALRCAQSLAGPTLKHGVKAVQQGEKHEPPQHRATSTSTSDAGTSDGEHAYRIWSDFLQQRLLENSASTSRPDPSKLRLLIREAVRAHSTRLFGDVVPHQFTSLFMRVYEQAVEPEDRRRFFMLLIQDHGVQREELDAVVRTWTSLQERQAGRAAEMWLTVAQQLQDATQPAYLRLFASISQHPRGLTFLVQLRGHLLQVLAQQPAYAAALRAMSEHLRKSLAQWFGVGLLQVHRLTWEGSSAALLEKVMEGEAVHPMHSWAQLRQRLGAGRRSFCVLHPSMPGQPLAVLHTALSHHAAAGMDEILSRDTAGSVDVAEAEAAAQWPVLVFYSISSTQPGLSGVDLGSFLIKSVAQQLQAAFPSVKQLVTLSPLPNFRSWLVARLTWELQRTGHMQLGASSTTGAAGAPADTPEPLLLPHEADRLAEAARSCGARAAGGGAQAAGGGSAAEQGQTNPPSQGFGSAVEGVAGGGDSLHGTLMGGGSGGGLTGGATGSFSGGAGGGLTGCSTGSFSGGAGGGLSGGTIGGSGGGASGGSGGTSSGAASPAGPLPPQHDAGNAALLWLLDQDRWLHSPGECEDVVKAVLLRLAARYLLRERRRNRALDPVAHFHVRNGATVWRLNWRADVSERGLQRSFGLMVNYDYSGDLEANNLEYVAHHNIVASPQVERLL